MITYLQAIDVFRTFAIAHLQVNKFDFEFREQMPNLATVNEAYPLLYVVPISSDTIQNVNEFDVDVYCVDRYQKDRSNVNYVVSDCNKILNDLVLWLEEGQDDLEIVGTPTQTPINNDLLDYVGGWVLRVRVQVEKIGLCEIPFGGEQPTPPTCPSGFIRNSDSTFTDIIPSGGLVVLNDVTIRVLDQFGNVIKIETIPSNIDQDIEIETPECEDATVTVNGNEFATVPSGETIDVPVVNGGSNPVGMIQDETVVIGNSSVFANGVQIGDVVAEDTLNIGIELDGTPAGIWNAGTQTWEVESVQLPIDITVNDILVLNDITTDSNIQLVDQDGNELVFTQTGNELEVVSSLFWELIFNDTNDVISILTTASNAGVFTSGSGSNVGTITVSTDGITYGALSFPFTTTDGTTYYFKRSTATVSGVFTLTGTY